MDLRYPIYLTRLLSSLIVGILIVLLIKYEFITYVIFSTIFDFQENILIKDWVKIFSNFTTNTKVISLYALPIYFFLGELFAGLGEIFILDPMFNNARASNTFSLLEFSKVVFNKLSLFIFVTFIPPIALTLLCVMLLYFSYINHYFIFVLLIFFISLFYFKFIISKRKYFYLVQAISFRKFNKFINRRERNFALSEMYFNMHRIIAGCAVTFWLLFLFWTLVLFKSRCGLLYDIFFSLFNLLLTVFCIFQARNQREFANKLIFYS